MSYEINFVISPSGWNIIDEFMKLSKEKSVYEIKILEICKRLDINRKTFYQNFNDRDDLICWIFSYHLHQYLLAHAPEKDIIFVRDIKDRKYLQLAYFSPNFFAYLKRCLTQHSDFIQNVMGDKEREPLSSFLSELYPPLFEIKLRQMERVQKLTKNERSFASNFVARSLFEYVLLYYEEIPESYLKNIDDKLIKAFVKN